MRRIRIALLVLIAGVAALGLFQIATAVDPNTFHAADRALLDAL